MAKIAEFNAPNETLTPSEQGAHGWQLAGRRLGVYYHEAAAATKEEGALQAQALKEQMWPWSILRMQESGRSYGPRPELINPARGGRNPMAGHGQISRGAHALGQLVRDGGYQFAYDPNVNPRAAAYYHATGQDYDLTPAQYGQVMARQKAAEDREYDRIHAYNSARDQQALDKYNATIEGNAQKAAPKGPVYTGANEYAGGTPVDQTPMSQLPDLQDAGTDQGYNSMTDVPEHTPGSTASVTPDASSTLGQLGAWITGVGGPAAAGAIAGSVIGPEGAAAGALAGAAAGYIGME